MTASWASEPCTGGTLSTAIALPSTEPGMPTSESHPAVHVQVTHPAKEPEQIKDSPAEGVYIHGLYLDGCAWSGRENKLVDAEPKKLFNPLPVLYVTGVLVSAPSCPEHAHIYACNLALDLAWAPLFSSK